MRLRPWYYLITSGLLLGMGAVAARAAEPDMGVRIRDSLMDIAKLSGFHPQGQVPRTFPQILGAYTNGLLTLLGLLFLIMIIRGGVIWMTAGGEEEKARQAKLIIKNSVYGLAIVLLARIFTGFYLNFLAPAVTTP